MTRTRPELPDIEGFERAEARQPLDPDALRLRRVVADHLELWFDCPRPECRQALACRSRIVACFDERRDRIVGRMTAFLTEGYVDADDCDC
ncbi:MAG: hypothetical protein KDK07_17820 [Bauldia sp.]|nr:hypothetical protein [Bauldia sp.]